MRIYRQYNKVETSHRGAAVAIGNFDGVHLGHRMVIDTAGRIARERGVPWGVLTFEPHPRMLFNPDTPPFRLTPFYLKARIVGSLGVDFLMVLRFNRTFSAMPAEQFVGDVLVNGLGAKHVVAGFDFVFGHKRRGDAAFLAAAGAENGFETVSIGEVKDTGGETISSTRARECLADGDPRAAAALLGRAYEIAGRVVTGDRRGRTIGFPTANIMLDSATRPATGVYAVQARLESEAAHVWHDGVANLGYRPTFGGTEPSLETHIFDFDRDIYGKRLRVALIEYLRPEKKFDGIEALTEQIKKDSADARRILSAGVGEEAAG